MPPASACRRCAASGGTGRKPISACSRQPRASRRRGDRSWSATADR
jgi:hypothetical protein